MCSPSRSPLPPPSPPAPSKIHYKKKKEAPDIWDNMDELEAAAAAAKLLQSCPTLCDPIDGSPPGSPVPGILQARTLEWVAFLPPVRESEKQKWSRSVVSDS